MSPTSRPPEPDSQPPTADAVRPDPGAAGSVVGAEAADEAQAEIAGRSDDDYEPL